MRRAGRYSAHWTRRFAGLWRRASLVLTDIMFGVQAEPPCCALLPLVSILFAISTSLGQTATPLCWAGTEPDKSAVNTDGTDPMRFVAFGVVQIQAGLQWWPALQSNRIADQDLGPIAACPSGARSAETPDRLPAVHHWFTADFDLPDRKNARSALDELIGV
jgi:hypothetical protein